MLPHDDHGRARAIVWTLAALNSIEPQSLAMLFLNISCGDKPWFAEAKAAVAPFLDQRLANLASALGKNEWLEERFTIGDLMMVEALRSIPNEVLAAHLNLAAYVARGTARPAFRRAIEGTTPGLYPGAGRRLIILEWKKRLLQLRSYD